MGKFDHVLPQPAKLDAVAEVQRAGSLEATHAERESQPQTQTKRKRKPRPADNAAVERDARWTFIECAQGRTDVAFSRRFLQKFGNVVLWVPVWKCWLVWDSRRWLIDGGGCAATRFAESVSDSIWHETIEHRTKDSLKYAADMAKPSRWATALKAAAAARATAVSDLNCNLWLLNCPNGTIDLRTGKLRPHRQEDLLTTLCPTPFNADATSYEWDKFQDGIFPSQAMQDFARRTIGYALSGRVFKAEEILPTWYGIGSNGKSVLIEAIRGTVGNDSATACAHGLLTEKTNDRHATERASLYGKRFVFCSETGQGAALDEDLIKSMTGGDSIKARFCHKDEFEFVPTFTIFLVTNHKPTVKGVDHGMWRRLNLWPFNQRFWCEWKGESGPPELKADAELRNKLEAERPGILAWMVRGCLEWQRDGLAAPEEVRIATAEYRSAEDTIGQFVAQNCLRMPSLRVKFNDFYQALTSWCEATGERTPKGRAVSDWLQQQGYEAIQSNGRWYVGIALAAIGTTERNE
ncbi:MAG: phage/plasmid primase, P4 family [Planctomycetaceae bacterium]|nr:phage/plasmid primase, P4 family [Planctomycetaceae bacterium]